MGSGVEWRCRPRQAGGWVEGQRFGKAKAVAEVVHVSGGGRVQVVRGREPDEERGTGESESGPGGVRGIVAGL